MPGGESWNSTIAPFEIDGFITTNDRNIPGLVTIYTLPSDCSNRWFQSSAGRNIYQCGPAQAGDKPADPRFLSCVASSQNDPFYSPAVCPNGYGIATMTEYLVKGVNAGWGAYCCRSGMTYLGTDSWCHSTFTTPQRVFVPVTTETDEKGNKTPIYENSTWSFTDGSYIAYTMTKVTTLTTGTAWEWPWWVEWRSQDLSLFPSAYATSLAKRINVPFTPTAAPVSTSSLPQQTGFHQSVPQQTDLSPPTSSPRLSSGAKAGISIGALAGATFLIGIAIFFVLRRRRRHTPLAKMDQHDELITKTRW